MRSLLLTITAIGLLTPLAFVLWFVWALDTRRPDWMAETIKNALRNGIKECQMKAADNKLTNFSDSPSFQETFSGYEIRQIPDPKLVGANCFAARAEPIRIKKQFGSFLLPRAQVTPEQIDLHTWFEIKYDPKTGLLEKTCGDAAKLGCDKGNTW